MRCYCSISRINNRRFSAHNNLSAWIMYSLTSVHSHSTLSYTDTYRFGASLCYSTTSSLTGKTVRHFGWVRNSCYCIEVLPRVWDVIAFPWPWCRFLVKHSTVYLRSRSKKTSKLRITGLCEGKSPVTGEFPAQRASNAEKVSIWIVIMHFGMLFVPQTQEDIWHVYILAVNHGL